MKRLLLQSVLISCFVPLIAFAAPSGQIGNGGDLCEDRIKSVRDDISSWIANGGASSLELPAAISITSYSSRMNTAIKNAKISCTDAAVKIGEAEKTCINWTAADGVPRISCNVQRLQETSESDQYVLIHHEFAGLAGFETTGDDGSSYVISNQISEYLQNQIVKRLGIKKQPVSPASSGGIAVWRFSGVGQFDVNTSVVVAFTIFAGPSQKLDHSDTQYAVVMALGDTGVTTSFTHAVWNSALSELHGAETGYVNGMPILYKLDCSQFNFNATRYHFTCTFATTARSYVSQLVFDSGAVTSSK